MGGCAGICQCGSRPGGVLLPIWARVWTQGGPDAFWVFRRAEMFVRAFHGVLHWLGPTAPTCPGIVLSASEEFSRWMDWPRPERSVLASFYACRSEEPQVHGSSTRSRESNPAHASEGPIVCRAIDSAAWTYNVTFGIPTTPPPMPPSERSSATLLCITVFSQGRFSGPVPRPPRSSFGLG